MWPSKRDQNFILDFLLLHLLGDVSEHYTHVWQEKYRTSFRLISKEPDSVSLIKRATDGIRLRGHIASFIRRRIWVCVWGMYVCKGPLKSVNKNDL